MNHIIKKYGIKAKKSLGQNFLVSEKILDSIVELFDITDKNIVEVGPGYGALTEKIMQQQPKCFDLIELDPDMVAILQHRKQAGDFGNSTENMNLQHIDVLKYTPTFQSYSVIANIPYYITSPILRHFIYNVPVTPDYMTILMQKDVADKIVAGSQEDKKLKSSVLSLFVLKKYTVAHGVYVGREHFIPSPKVDSSVLVCTCHKTYEHIDDTGFLAFIKQGFSSPRKKLYKNLVSAGYDIGSIEHAFTQLSLGENIRPEKLSISQWCNLFLLFHKSLK